MFHSRCNLNQQLWDALIQLHNAREWRLHVFKPKNPTALNSASGINKGGVYIQPERCPVIANNPNALSKTRGTHILPGNCCTQGIILNRNNFQSGGGHGKRICTNTTAKIGNTPITNATCRSSRI